MGKQRFYDQHPVLKQTVDTFLLFPEDMQVLIAAALSQIAQRDYQLKEIMDNLKTLGVEVILSLHKSKRKQREYDKNPLVHKAMNDLMVISPQNRLLLARQTLGLMGSMQRYLKLCQESGMPPQKEALQSLVSAYVQGGAEEAASYIQQVQRTMPGPSFGKLGTPSEAPGVKTPLVVNETVHSESSGMRLKHESQDDAD